MPPSLFFYLVLTFVGGFIAGIYFMNLKEKIK